MPQLISKHRPIRILTVGFALVILALTAMAWLGLRQADTIRLTAAKMTKEHLFTARLVDGLERQQQRASSVLLDTVRNNGDADKLPLILAKLETFERSLPTLVEEGRNALPEQNWSQLEMAASAFGAQIRQALARKEFADVSAQKLETSFEEFLHASDQVIKQDSIHAAEMENRIELASVNLVDRTGWLLGLCLLLALVCAALTIQFTVNSLNRLEWQAEELNRVSWHLIQGQEEAARRFSHEMHDELGQSLTGLKAMLAAVTPAELPTRRADCLSLLDETIGNVRELSQLLRPVILDDFGLEAALRWLADRFQERTRLEVNFQGDAPGRFADEIETHLFRITQEALTNVARHSGATQVQIQLKRQDEQLTLTVRDNGTGIQRKEHGELGLGLVGMRARAEQLGGTFTIGNTPEGVLLRVVVPTRLPESSDV
jgi:signal transduction histidine kinase